ncbi:MAG: redoxin family protein [Gemmataceae bacterium]
MFRAALLIALLLVTSGQAAERVEFPPLLDTAGGVHRVGEGQATKATVLVFLNPTCPLCQRYAPTLNKLAAGKNAAVEMYGVVSNAPVTFKEAAAFAREYGLKFPVLFDGSAAVAARLKPTHVPEAFVLTAAGEVAYRGRIDDWYEAPAKPRPEVRTHDLADAITAVLAGKALANAKTEPVGCLFEDTLPKPDAAPAGVNYNRHVASILLTRCASCHRPGEVAPFPLQSFADASKRAKQIAAVTGDRTMPPWKATRGYGHFQDEQHLSAAEIATLKAWAADGAPEGAEADKPTPPKFADGWYLGPPDLIVKMPEAYTVPAGGKDVIRNFVIPIDVPESKMITAIQFRPGNKKVVHHALLLLDITGQGRKLDAAEPGPGYGSAKGGVGFIPSGGLGGWAPGVLPRHLPAGTGRFLAKGSDAILQIHYHPSGKEETDQSEFGVYFAKTAALKPLGGVAVENWAIDMPAGEREYRRSAEYTLPASLTLVGTAPHMHLLGKSMKVWAETPDGKTVPLVHIENWDFNWQDYYLYQKPFTLPKGTKLRLESVHDNSSSNPANPNSPPKRITWGEGTADEMCLCLFEGYCDTALDMIRVVTDNATHNKVVERFMEPTAKKK